MTTKFTRRLTFLAMTGCVVLSCLVSIGCQTTRNGQPLPSPHYLDNPPQFFAPSSEFLFSQEAAQLEKDQAEYLKARQQQ